MGEKLYYWEMKGVPLRIEIGPRDVANGECIIIPRDIGKTGSVTLKLELVEIGV